MTPSVARAALLTTLIDRDVEARGHGLPVAALRGEDDVPAVPGPPKRRHD
jgi:hypothetical protein